MRYIDLLTILETVNQWT